VGAAQNVEEGDPAEVAVFGEGCVGVVGVLVVESEPGGDVGDDAGAAGVDDRGPKDGLRANPPRQRRGQDL
jgi:hypothetical protein